MFKWLDPKALAELFMWYFKGHDEKKLKRILGAVMVAFLLVPASLYLWGIWNKMQYAKRNNLPPPAAASK